MKFPRLAVIALVVLGLYIWILVLILSGTAVRYEHFPVAPLEDPDPGVR